MEGFLLQSRDREIIEFLRVQGFATFEQIKSKFFKSKSRASARLNKLQEVGVIEYYTFNQYYQNLSNGRFLPFLLELSIRPTTRLLQLTSTYLSLFSENSKLALPNMLLHQLLLNDIRFFLETHFKTNTFLNDTDFHIFAKSLNNKEPLVPDLSFKIANSIFAIELERTLKSKTKYTIRMSKYSTSKFTHILYYYTNESYLETLLKSSGPFRKVGFVNVFNKDIVISKFWGKMNLYEWTNKVNSISSADNFTNHHYQF